MLGDALVEPAAVVRADHGVVAPVQVGEDIGERTARGRSRQGCEDRRRDARFLGPGLP